MPLPESLHLEKADFPPGTFVPSAKLASNGLLEVRAVIFAPNNEMFVADRAADCVRIYEARTGRHLRNLSQQSDQLDRPIHLLLSPDGRYLLIGSGGKDSILRHDLRQGSTSVFVEPKSAGLNGPGRNGIWRRWFPLRCQSQFKGNSSLRRDRRPTTRQAFHQRLGR